ncbi:MAG: DUF4358 domain-containing protein [Clostridia bacterium]|nr:DUF4358 domain-containing protein [Clostridia bacterium]
MKQRISTLVIAVILLSSLLLAGCTKQTFRNDVPLLELQPIIEPLVTHADHLDTLDDDYRRFNFPGTEDASEVLIRQSVSGTSLDEYGLFRASELLGADEIADICSAYLKQRNDAWLGLYMLEEYPKLRDAEVKIFGEYVLYMILSEEDKAEVISAVEAALK